jgi:DNA-binding NarL/FixJ family response regulator
LRPHQFGRYCPPVSALPAFVTDTTAKTHLRSILSKLALQSRIQIVIFAYENGLLDY